MMRKTLRGDRGSLGEPVHSSSRRLAKQFRASCRLRGAFIAAYRSVNATSRELKTGLNMYRMIDFEPV